MSGTAGKKPSSRGAPKAREHQIVHYMVTELIPPGHVLALNRELALLSYLGPQWDEEPWPHVLLQEQFSPSEERILFPLLENYPHFCPHEALVACYFTGQITEASLERYRLRLQEARLADVWDHEMRPVRAILSRVRFKLRTFGIEVCSILETGYMLKQAEEKPTEKP
jgi:hypothetical protein